MTIQVADALAAIDRLIETVDRASLDIVTAGAQQVKTEAQMRAAKLSGQNAASITIEAPVNSGRRYGMTGVTLSRYAWSRRVGPTSIYGRIREVGGRIPGRKTTMNHPFLRWWDHNGKPVFARSVYQRGDKYLQPATENARGTYLGLATRKWGAAILSI